MSPEVDLNQENRKAKQTPIIEIKNLTKIYKSGNVTFCALDNISLSINSGEFVAIMGQSGSGKSTLMHLLGFLDNPDSGSYFFKGKDTSKMSDSEYASYRKKHIGFVFQQFHLLPRLSVEKNILLPLIYSGMFERESALDTLLSQVGLPTKKKNNPNQLSGGERQRVAICRALINDPEIIMADEPTGNLDSKSEQDIIHILLDLHAQGKTVIMVTHEEELAKHAERIVRFKDGKIISDIQNKNSSKEKVIPFQVAKNIRQSILKKTIEYVNQALQTMAANKVRSFLSMLGIVIGVATVVAMLGLVNGAKAAISDSLTQMGTNLLQVIPDRRSQSQPITLQDNDTRAFSSLPQVKRISPQVNGGVTAIVGDKNLSPSLMGCLPNYASIHSLKFQAGQFFNDDNELNRDRVCVIGSTVTNELFGGDAVGKILKLNRSSFRVVGQLESVGGGNSFRDRDNAVYIPLATAMHRLLGKTTYDDVDVEIRSNEEVDAAQKMLEKMIIKSHGVDPSKQLPFRILNMADIQATLNQTTNNLSFLLSFIASLSLLVGGIGIMNIMLVSVTERTREIGIRKAIGATKPDVLAQFIIEAVILTFAGGLIGIAFGGAIVFILGKVAGWTTKITPSSLFVSSFFSIAIGLIFGIWPAKKASDLNSIDALRFE